MRQSVENCIYYVYTTTVSERKAVGHVSGRSCLIRQHLPPNREVETYYNLHPTQALRGLVRVKTERMAGR